MEKFHLVLCPMTSLKKADNSLVSGPDFIHIVVVGGMPGYTGVWCYPDKLRHQTKLISRGYTD